MLALVMVREQPVKVLVTEQASAGQYLVPVRRCGLAKTEPSALIQQEEKQISEEKPPPLQEMENRKTIQIDAIMMRPVVAYSKDQTIQKAALEIVARNGDRS